MKNISVLMKPSSGMCNMSCDYCFYCDEAQKRCQESYGFMTEGTLKNIIRKTMLRAESAVTYAYQGGEPTLRGLDFFKKAVEYQRQYNKKEIRIMNSLQTNGFTINEDWCRFFKENEFLIGISIDGLKETHDCVRHDRAGNGTYDRILQSTKLMDQYKVDYNILTVVSHKVANSIEEIYHNYKRHGWNYQQYIACLDPLGETRGQKEYALRPEEYGRFLIQLFDLWYNDYLMGKQPYIRQFENYIGILAGYQAEACDQRGVCGIQYGVEADGGVYPCDFYMLDEYSLGNFNKNNLDDINSERVRIGFIERSLEISEECKKCSYYNICRGGCQRNRDINEETGLYSNYFCESYKMFFDTCFSRLKKIAESIK